ncbi:hypothetical protein ANN_06242 [Periplaneta americana]|uniref:Uncharacterized protein n=1 Tax=Periplaneta americana TaxID=6978 RepID=A0ABQ8TFH6_PERAM|nr:hypothetical protein ANN_06242 [Periplaneta americana]
MAGLCEGGNEPSGSLKAIFSGRQRRAPWGYRLLPAENTLHYGALVAASGYALYLFLLHDGAHGTDPLTLCTFQRVLTITDLF